MFDILRKEMIRRYEYCIENNLIDRTYCLEMLDKWKNKSLSTWWEIYSRCNHDNELGDNKPSCDNILMSWDEYDNHRMVTWYHIYKHQGYFKPNFRE